MMLRGGGVQPLFSQPRTTNCTVQSPPPLYYNRVKFETEKQMGRPLEIGMGAKRYLFRDYKKYAKISFKLDFNTFINICQSQCVYCGRSPSQIIGKANRGTFIYNGIDRVNNDIGYTKDNSVSCCKICNYMKHTSSKDEFLSNINRIYNHIKLK